MLSLGWLAECGLASTIEDGWQLDDGEQRHRESPATFYLPSLQVRASLQPGQVVKLIFRIALADETAPGSAAVERMWVIVEQPLQDGKYLGTFDNDPKCAAAIRAGTAVVFEPKHVIQVHSAA